MSAFNKDRSVFLIAEIGGNHEGDFDYAIRLLDLAAESGAHAVKFQAYSSDRIVNPIESPERNTHFKKFELSDTQYIELAKRVRAYGLEFMCSVWDEHLLSLLDPYINIHKVGSGDLTNYPLLKKIALTKKPLIISTAMSTLDEVREAVSFIDSVAPEIKRFGNLALLHCVAMYGEPKDEYANLKVIQKLQNEFKECMIGYSDHTIGSEALEIAVALGACILEFHFTDDTTRSFRDHGISLTKSQVQAFSDRIKKVINLLGHDDKSPVSAIETSERICEFRRAVYPNRDLIAGEIISENMLTTLRPNHGTSACRFYDFIGKRLKISKRRFELILLSDVEDTGYGYEDTIRR